MANEFLLKKMSEGPEYLGPLSEPTFVQNFKQSEIPEQVVEQPAEGPEYIAPLKPPDMLDYLREPVEWFKSGMGGLAGGVAMPLKTAALIPGSERILDPAISVIEESAEWWEPKESAPGKVSNWVRGAAHASGQSISALLTGLGIAAAAGKVGLPALTIGAILSKGAFFGGAHWYDLTKEIEKEAVLIGANAEEIAILQKEFATWKGIEALAEVGGEWASDFLSARIFGLTGNPAIRTPVKAGILAAFGRFGKKMGYSGIAQIAGEEATTAVQYVGHEEMSLPKDSYWKQVEDTAGITGFQQLIMGPLASAAGSSRGRSKEALAKDFKSKASAALVSKGVDKDTADTIADTIVKNVSKTDAADNAIAELEEREAARKRPKAEREVKKAEKKKAAAVKSKEIIQTILAPEITEKIEPIIEEKPTPREEKLAKLRAFGEKKIADIEVLSIELKAAREEKLAKLKGETLAYRAGPTFETAIRQPTEVALPKQETTFIRLEPSENPEVPDVIVADSSGSPKIFNPDIHVLTNQNEARRAIENWTPTAKPAETTRERRIRILQEAGRITPEQPTQVPVVEEEVEATSTPAEVVAIMKKLRPGFVEHVSAMSKKGWTIDDFINDPDVTADLEGIVSEARYYDLIMNVKEEIGAMTSTDVFDRQIREEQRALDEDFAEIDKMKNEDLMQKEPAEEDRYYDVEQHKWVQLEKETIADNIEKQFVEPPPSIENVPVVIQVPTEIKKAFSRKVINNTVWYQPKEEAMTQLDLLKQIKLSWDSDIDTILHALSTQANAAYHMNGEVPFTALARFEDNLDYFKKNLSHGEYDRLTNSLNSLRAFMVDVSDTLKSTEEPIYAAPPAEVKTPAQIALEEFKNVDIYKLPKEALQKYLDAVKLRKQELKEAIKEEEVQPGAPRLEKYESGLRFEMADEITGRVSDEATQGRFTKASNLLDMLLAREGNISVDHIALARYFNTPAIRQMLDKVGVILHRDPGPTVFYMRKSITGPVIGISNDYAYKASAYNISVAQDMLHEMLHAITVNTLETSKPFQRSIDDLRLKALDGLNDNDRRIVIALRGDAAAFHDLPYEVLGLSRGSEYSGIYYGLINSHEFITQALTDTDFQLYLSKIPYSGEKVDGKVITMWDRFKDVLSWIIFNKPMGERESTLLDAVLNKTREVIEYGSSKQHENLAFEARERSINASAPRIKSIEVEQALQSYPLKGSGVHAGLGTPIQQNVYIKEGPPDILRWAVHAESPLFALRDHPDALGLAGEAIDSLGTWTYNRSLGFIEIDRITKELDDKERRKVTAILKEIESGEAINLDTLAPKIRTAVVNTRKFLDFYKEKLKKFFRESLVLSGNVTEARILEDVLVGGEDAFSSIKKWNRYARDYNKNTTGDRIGTTTEADMLNIFKEWKEIESFGIKDYITHAMRGSIALIDSEGRVIAFAQTKDKAVKAALKYAKENPTVESITVDTDYRLDKDFQTLVSQKHYRVMKGKISKLINQYAEDVGKDLADKLKAELPGKSIAIKPQKIWSQFLQEREEVLPGEEDIFDILPLYVHSTEKKMALDPYIIKLRENLHKFSDTPNVKKMLEDQLEAMRGQYTEGDAIVDGLLAKLGILTTKIHPSLSVEQSFSYTRGLAATRVLITNLKLGYRPVASLVNLLSGMGHVWVKTSAKYMIEANKVLRTEGGKEFIKKNAPSLGTSIIEGMGGTLENKLEWYSPLKLFQAPEIPNRELSFVTSYLFSRDQFGYDEVEAVEFAKRAVDTQEFIYSVAAIPKILRGPGGRTIGQFRAYLIKEIEFIRGLKGANQWAKYLTMQAVLGGPRGIMIMLKSLPFLHLIGGDDWLDSLDAWLNNSYPKLSRGVFGFFGIDASAPATFQFPESIQDLAGVLLSDIYRFGRDVAKPFTDGESYIWEDIKKFTKGTIPVWRIWSEMFEGLMSEDGWILDEHGNNKYKVESWTDIVKMVGGFKPLKMAAQDLEVRLAKVLEDKEKAQAHKIVEQIVKRSRLIDVDIVTEELVNEVAMHAISPESIIAAILASHLDPATRQLLATKMARRMELWQRQLPVREFRGY